ncbi:MAG TPA: glutathione S-transferase family protein [Caulobacteraceae bacterium]|jgi:glutathione S-transferase|nr:glutathione S-transferase family protein [Caulobacteraceae bacterium]
MQPFTIYGDSRSGNCLKVKWTADRLGLAYRWVEVDVMDGTTRSPEFLAVNPAGQVPTVVFADGRPLAQSNAIILHLAEGSDLIPTGAYDRARMFEWLFWEQYSHEPYIAVRRFLKLFLGKTEDELDPKLEARGRAALARMEKALSGSAFLVGDRLTLADICLVAYTRLAHEGGFDLADYPAVSAWVKRVDKALGL